MSMSNFVDKPEIVKAEATSAGWKTRRVKAILGSSAHASTSAFSSTTVVVDGTDQDLEKLASGLPHVRVERSNRRVISVTWPDESPR